MVGIKSIINRIIRLSQDSNPVTLTTISGSPSLITTDQFPGFIDAWGANLKKPVDDILNTLNQTIYYMSRGQTDFFRLKGLNFSSDINKYDDFTNGIINFSKLFYNKILNNGAPFKEEIKDKKQLISQIKYALQSNSAIPDYLNNNFPQSFLKTKIANPKGSVISLLSQIETLV